MDVAVLHQFPGVDPLIEDAQRIFMLRGREAIGCMRRRSYSLGSCGPPSKGRMSPQERGRPETTVSASAGT